MIKHIPDAVDVVKLDFEGQRRVVVPGYMTSADILRNMLLNSNSSADASSGPNSSCTAELKSAAPLIIQRQSTHMSLKEKLLMQQRSQQNTGVLIIMI